MVTANPYLKNRTEVRQRLLRNARESSAFEGVRVAAKVLHARPLPMASEKKRASAA